MRVNFLKENQGLFQKLLETFPHNFECIFELIGAIRVEPKSEKRVSFVMEIVIFVSYDIESQWAQAIYSSLTTLIPFSAEYCQNVTLPSFTVNGYFFLSCEYDFVV